MNLYSAETKSLDLSSAHSNQSPRAVIALSVKPNILTIMLLSYEYYMINCLQLCFGIIIATFQLGLVWLIAQGNQHPQ